LTKIVSIWAYYINTTAFLEMHMQQQFAFDVVGQLDGMLASGQGKHAA